MKIALTLGGYDLLHIGHVQLFRRAKFLPELESGSLIVTAQDSDYILKYKPHSTIVNDTPTRMFMVNAIKYVDRVITYKDVDKDIQNIDFDIFVKGPWYKCNMTDIMAGIGLAAIDRGMSVLF